MSIPAWAPNIQIVAVRETVWPLSLSPSFNIYFNRKMPASKPVRPTQPHLYDTQVENPQRNRQESPVDRSSNQPATVYRQTDLVHSLQYRYAPFTGHRAVQTGPINTSSGKRLERPVDCDGCVVREMSCTWTSKVICTSIFREVFVSGDSAKVKPEYNRLLETIHEGDEGGD